MFHPILLLLLAFAGLVAGGAESASSTAPGQSSPGNTSLPSISGSAAVGQTLTASVGTWAGPTPTYTFQWQRCDSSGNSCSAVGSGTASYTLASGDAGATMRVTVTATNKNGSSVATSSPTAVVTGPSGQTTTTSTTTTSTTTTGTTTTTPSAGFTTSLTQNGTITTPYTWTFNPGVPTSAGYFWADGVLLAKVTGPGPYSYTLQPGKLSSGVHSFGHAWDLTTGTHQTPSGSYSETVDPAAPATTTTTAATTTTTPAPTPAPSGTVYFDGRARNMTALSSVSTTSQTQSPALWDCLCFNNNSITLATDSTFGQVYHAVIGPGNRSPWNTGMPTNDADGRMTKGRGNDFGKWNWFSFALRVPSGWSNPDWASVLSLEYETLAADQIAVQIYPSSTGPVADLYMNTGQVTKNSSGFYAGTVSGIQGQIAKITYGQWLDVVIGIKVASDNTGAVEVYTRTPGGTWSHPVEKLNIPTWAYGCTSYGCVNANGTNTDGSQHTVLDKVGLYYGYWNTSTTSFPTETVDVLGFARSSDQATAQSLLP